MATFANLLDSLFAKKVTDTNEKSQIKMVVPMSKSVFLFVRPNKLFSGKVKTRRHSIDGINFLFFICL